MRSSEIVLDLHSADQLFIAHDSLFYGKRMLNPDAEEIIIEEATTASSNDHFHLKIHLGKDGMSRKDEIETAIHRHFNYRRKKSEREIKRILYLGWRGLLISIAFLAFLISLTLFILKQLPEGGFSVIIREILVILGWVALWRPADFLLYEWRQFKREVNLFRKLEQCKVEIIANTNKLI